MKNIVLMVVALSLIVPMASVAQECDELATVGNFDVSFEGASFDGTSTEFTYCVTGVDGDDFRALSNWGLALDPACVFADDLAGCSTDDCYYQVDDPNLGITGIKFDEVEVEAGDTACYSFSLDGDWSRSLGPVEIGLKAGKNVSSGSICGPICLFCEATVSVTTDADGAPHLDVSVLHNRPPTVITPVFYGIVAVGGERVHRWEDGPITLSYGSTYSFSGAIPGLPDLAPGDYRLVMRLRGMSGWITRTAEFSINE
jgi:hypothetical protein